MTWNICQDPYQNISTINHVGYDKPVDVYPIKYLTVKGMIESVMNQLLIRDADNRTVDRNFNYIVVENWFSIPIKSEWRTFY